VGWFRNIGRVLQALKLPRERNGRGCRPVGGRTAPVASEGNIRSPLASRRKITSRAAGVRLSSPGSAVGGPCLSPGPSGDLKLPRPPDAPHARRGGFSFQVSRPRLFTPAMTEPPLEPWMTSSAGPFVTIKPGGPLHGVVTISVAPDTASTHSSSTRRGNRSTATRAPCRSRLTTTPPPEGSAHQWADQLAAGHEPTPLIVGSRGPATPGEEGRTRGL